METLNIFPPGGLTSSVITTVWLGVMVVGFFNLRFGWVFSGLVVPGYLVPLIITRPWSALVILIEALITLFIVRLISDRLSRLGYWCNFFGRDRFFAILLVSVMVRLTSDVFLMPFVGESINNLFGIQFDYRTHLHSFGLIIIALIANQLWKTGVVKGAFSFFITTGTTFILVRFVLMEFTNFSLANLELMYEAVAISLASSPKAYIIILTVAFIASRMNLKYGWDFNGILIPALLALQWYQPGKIVTTFVETGFIFIVGDLVLRLPIIRNMTVEKARKVLVFFNVSFMYKMIVGHVIYAYFPAAQTSDYYGFGYLLPTLLAINIHEKRNAPRLLRITLQTSLVAVCVACITGYGLTFVPDFTSGVEITSNSASISVIKEKSTLLNRLTREFLTVYSQNKPDSIKQPLASERSIFRSGLKHLLDKYKLGDSKELEKAALIFSRIKYQVSIIEDRYIFLSEIKPGRGWGFYTIDMKNPRGLVIEIPAPSAEWLVVESGYTFLSKFNGFALAVSGSSPKINKDGSADVTSNSNTFFHVFHKTVGRRNVLQIRGMTKKYLKNTHSTRLKVYDFDQSFFNPSLWVKRKLPDGLDLSLLRKIIGKTEISFSAFPLKNIQYRESYSGFAELYLPRHSRRKLVSLNLTSVVKVQRSEYNQAIDGYLQDWILGNKEVIAPKGSDRYIIPKLSEMLFMDQQVLSVMIRLTGMTSSYPELYSTQWREELNTLSFNAGFLGYKVSWYKHKGTSEQYLILSEKEDSVRHWGIYVFRVGSAEPFILQVPKPLMNSNTFEYGVSLFEQLHGRILCLAGAHPMANRDGSSDVSARSNILNLFNVVNQVTLREKQGIMMTLQVRGLAYRGEEQENKVDGYIAFSDGTMSYETLTPLGLRLFEDLKKGGLDLDIVTGKKHTSSCEALYSTQFRFMKYSRNKEFSIVWVLPHLRAAYSQQESNMAQESRFIALGMPYKKHSLPDYLSDYYTVSPYAEPIPEKLKADLLVYLETRNIITLNNLIKYWKDYDFKRVLDINSQQFFLLLARKKSSFSALVNLNPIKSGTSLEISRKKLNRDMIDDFVTSRVAWMTVY